MMTMRTRAQSRWTRKARLFRWLGTLPRGGDAVHYILQRWVSRSLPRSDEACRRALENTRRHLRNLYPTGVEAGLYYEFGAGWDIFQNLALYCHGVDRQLIIDLQPLLRPRLANESIAYLARCADSAFVRRPGLSTRVRHPGDLQRYGIDYRAPADARHVELRDASVRAIATTNTLEHIPADALGPILAECRRICAADGRVSMRIDYSDHYAHTDKSITPYNFLRFSAAAWARYSPPNHYQNRLRHSDYVRLFEQAGFEITAAEVNRPENWRELLARTPLDPQFAGRPAQDVAVTDAFITARPRP